jgi:HEAT repeat protein
LKSSGEADFLFIMKNFFKKIQAGGLEVLDKQVFSEVDLAILADLINQEPDRQGLVHGLVNSIPKFGKNFDWNVGSILRHIEVQLIINILSDGFDERLFNSIGLAWVLGEFKNTNRVIIDFLYKTVDSFNNSDAWWRAAFSLEKLGREEAVNLLKRSVKAHDIKELEYYFDHIDDKRSVISILVLSNVDNIEHVIYPRIKQIFLSSNEDQKTINCCWLIGRLKLIDKEIYTKLVSLIYHNNYELKYYTFFALQNNAIEPLRPILERALKDADPLIRKMAVRGLRSIGNEQSLGVLGGALYREEYEDVIAEISTAIYHLKNPLERAQLLIEIKSYRNENGMISDESDKWYRDPSVYHTFSEAQDPENVCFSLIQECVKGMTLQNPIDLASGTGRLMWQIIDKMLFDGALYALDASEQMCNFLQKTIRRERKFTSNVKVVRASIIDAPDHIKVKSNFIVSSFGFPSKISNKKLCLEELQAVYDLLSDDGLFFTMGWDETFNDELSHMWYKFIPDRITAHDFEEWRRKRTSAIASPRNCGLKWFKKGISVPVQFTSLKESAYVMGYLFGRDAAQDVVNKGKVEWNMSLGITRNTKKELAAIIKSL